MLSLQAKYFIMSQKSKQTVALILIMIFAFYYANICSFYHSHIINGVTIVHSHFHNKAHAQTGTHSDSELTLISTLSVFHSLQAALCFVGTGIFLLLQVFILPFFEERIISNPAACISLRGPPL
jgi:hypothetical protein